MAGVALAVVAAGLLVPAMPASAHGSETLPSTNYRSEVVSLQPSPAGVSVRVIEAGNRFELSNRGGEDIVVVGYEGEPMLRVGPTGAFENRRSPSIYRSASPPRNVPVDATSAAESQWRRVSGGAVMRWHDLRADPGQAEELSWTVPLRQRDQLFTLTGTLRYVPGPNPLPWLGVAALLLAGTAATAVLRPRRWRLVMATALVVTVALDMVHSFGRFAASYAGLGNRFFDLFFPFLAWAGAGMALRRLARRPTALPAMAGFAGLGLFFIGGMGDFAAVTQSQLPFAFAPTLARVAVTSALGVGGGLMVALLWYAFFEPLPVPEAPGGGSEEAERRGLTDEGADITAGERPGGS